LTRRAARWLLAASIAIIVVATAREIAAVTKWSLIEPPLPEGHQPEAILFEEGIGFALGHVMPADAGSGPQRMTRMKAFILRRARGADTWSTVYSGRGTLFRASTVGGGVLYALGETFLPDGSRAAFIEKSQDHGATWKPLPPPPEGLVGFRFLAQRRALAWSAGRVYATQDDGATWTEVAAARRGGFTRSGPGPVVDGAGAIRFADRDVLARVAGAQRDDEPLPPAFETYDLCAGPDGALWLLGELGEGEVRLYRERDGKLDLAATFPSFLPKALHVGAKAVLVAGADVGKGDDPPRHFLLVSVDGGKSWDREKPAVTSRLSPLWFEADEVVWAYANLGRIQRRAPGR